MTYRRLKILDYTITVVLTLLTAILVLGIATARHARADEYGLSPRLPFDRALCYGYVKEPSAYGKDSSKLLGVVGPGCYFLKGSAIAHEILSECPWESYCRIEVSRNEEDTTGPTKKMHPITLIFVVRNWEEGLHEVKPIVISPY